MNMDVPRAKRLTYPRMTALRSCWNVWRQKIMKMGTQWLQRSRQEANLNPYLEGVFAPSSEVHQIACVHNGQIPLQLNGILLRIGPNPIHAQNPNFYHWFSGDGMIHGLRIESGQVLWYKSRYIATDTIQNNKKHYTC